MLDWFSMKYVGFFILPISWYNAPTLINIAFAPTSLAQDSARFATFKEWWNVPGALLDNSLSNFVLVSDSSKSDTSDTSPNNYS